MSQQFTNHFAEVNGIKMHYIEYKNDKPKLLFMHGLTANSHAVEGMIRGGLADHFHVYSIDFRGRGLSTKVAFHYSIEDHADDIIQMLDHLKISKIILCGHSFGGLMASYLAFYYPEKFTDVIILDAAPEMNPNAGEMLLPAMSRIDTRFTNFTEYLESVKNAPYNTEWHDEMEIYYKSDVATAEDGSVEPISNISDIILIATAVSKENWENYFENMKQRSLLIVALDDYSLNQPLLPTTKAKAILAKMKHASYIEVSGNHQTMLYGKNAEIIVRAITKFIAQN